MSNRVADPRLPGVHAGARPPGSRARRRGAALVVAALAAATFATPALAANVPPVAGVDTITGAEDTQLTGNILANDRDSDGGTLVILSVTQPTYGTLVVAANGDATFTPPANWSGKQTTTYWLSDSQGGTSLGYINLDVTPVNDVPVAQDLDRTTAEDTPLVIAAATLAAAASDVDGDTLSVTEVGGAHHGTVGLAAGDVTFEPAANWCGTGAGFDWTVSDGHGGTDTAAVHVTVTCVNDPPVTVADEAAVAQGTGPVTVNVTANDTDADGDALTVTGASVAAEAGTAVKAGAASVTFTPAAAFTGDAVVTYTVTDGNGGTVDGTLTVSVVKDEAPPVVAVPGVRIGTNRVDERASATASWSATDAGVGVASYEVQMKLSGGAWTTVYTGTGTSVSRWVAFRTWFAFRVRATDKVGNVSDWVTGPSRRVDDMQAPGSTITWSGTWTNVSTTTASRDAYRYATARGASATLKFTGLEVAYVAPKLSTGGYAKVYVDGVYVGRYSLRSSSTVPGAVVFRKAWPVAGTHTIKVVNDYNGRRTTLDAFLVLR